MPDPSFLRRHYTRTSQAIALGLLLSLMALLSADAQDDPQPTAPPSTTQNQVLELDGKGSYLELPPNIFDHLTDATVEGWVKWSSFANHSRFFDIITAHVILNIRNEGTQSQLYLEAVQSGVGREFLRMDSALQLGEWVHLAAVSTSSSKKLYLNGILITDTPSRDMVATNLEPADRNYLGRTQFHVGRTDDKDFHGQMDEIRIWSGERTAQQIRANLFARLTGHEPGLVGLWNFDDPENPGRDASPHRFDGTVVLAEDPEFEPTIARVILSAGSPWKYLDDGSDQGTAWRAADFDDSGWATGEAPLGYDDGSKPAEVTPIKTTVSFGPAVTSPSRLTGASLRPPSKNTAAATARACWWSRTTPIPASCSPAP